MTKQFTIPGVLMALNEYTDKQRANRYGGAAAKKKKTKVCAFFIKQAMNQGLEVESYPIDITFIWFMPNRMKDKDNISFSKKFVLDGMQEAGLIENDGWKQIGDFQDKFRIDKEKPRVEVIITERESGKYE